MGARIIHSIHSQQTIGCVYVCSVFVYFPFSYGHIYIYIRMRTIVIIWFMAASSVYIATATVRIVFAFCYFGKMNYKATKIVNRTRAHGRKQCKDKIGALNCVGVVLIVFVRSFACLLLYDAVRHCIPHTRIWMSAIIPRAECDRKRKCESLSRIHIPYLFSAQKKNTSACYFFGIIT